jgi:cytochrome b involved in lipid metabolism
MLSHDKAYASTKKWQANADIPTFFLVLSSSAADDGRKHVDHYVHKGLMTKLRGVPALAEWMGIPKQILATTLSRYVRDAKKGRDEFGKDYFPGLPTENLDGEVFYAGIVTPVLHYCMGGITINSKGDVLDEHDNIIEGLHAVGEVTGGVHGNNRLGGNSLLECTVFGTIVGQKIPVAATKAPAESTGLIEKDKSTSKELKLISREELQRHNKPDDCWVAINNVVYDLTAFAPEHPAGAQSIFKLAGKDGTEAFEAVHNQNMLADVEEDKVGMLLVDTPVKVNNTTTSRQTESNRVVSIAELKNHNHPGDCWVAFHGQVYNMTNFAPSHPGGEQLILNVAGTDGTNAFDNVHSKKKLNLVEDNRIGTLLT